MTDQIGRADYVLGTDNTGVKTGTAAAEAEILKSGARVEADATTRGYRIGAAIGTGIKVVATASTALFAIAAKGAIELQNVTADFQAQTGATAAEADRAGKAINAMSGRNIQGIKEIGSALTKVHTDMGLTGDEAEAPTERFLKFARATKQDAAGAVIAFDNILDAWGLTAKDATGIMDKLIVSHQKYGGSIVENQAASRRWRPSSRRSTSTIDDGIGLLNLFASGLDAATGQKALNTAISNLPPGETMDQFIARLSHIEDDGARAQEAIKVFGARAGAGARQRDPPGRRQPRGVRGLGGRGAGATVKAADAMDSTFSAQVQLKIKAVGAAISEHRPGADRPRVGAVADRVVRVRPQARRSLQGRAAGPHLRRQGRWRRRRLGAERWHPVGLVGRRRNGHRQQHRAADREYLRPTKSTVIGNAFRSVAAKGAAAYAGALKIGEGRLGRGVGRLGQGRGFAGRHQGHRDRRRDPPAGSTAPPPGRSRKLGRSRGRVGRHPGLCSGDASRTRGRNGSRRSVRYRRRRRPSLHRSPSPSRSSWASRTVRSGGRQGGPQLRSSSPCCRVVTAPRATVAPRRSPRSRRRRSRDGTAAALPAIATAMDSIDRLKAASQPPWTCPTSPRRSRRRRGAWARPRSPWRASCPTR